MRLRLESRYIPPIHRNKVAEPLVGQLVLNNVGNASLMKSTCIFVVQEEILKY